MTRIRLPNPGDLDGADREFFAQAQGYGPFGNLVAAMANRPPIMHHTFSLLIELKAENVLPQRYLELALVTVSRLSECTYCVSHHTPNLTIAGVSQAAALNILDYDNQPEFDAVDRLVIEYATEVTLRWNTVRDGIFTRLREHFDDAQITELTWRTALCGAFNRFNDVLQLDVEPEVEVLEQGMGQAAV